MEAPSGEGLVGLSVVERDTRPVLVAQLPDPQATDTDQDADPDRGHRNTSGAMGPQLTTPRRAAR